MGVRDNLAKLKKALDNKNAVSRIGMEAVKQGSLESNFTSDYSAFSVSLREILEKALINNNDKSITISAKKGSEKYLNYALQDEHFIAYYIMRKDGAGNVTFSLKETLNDIIYGDSENVTQSKYEQQLEKFMDN